MTNEHEESGSSRQPAGGRWRSLSQALARALPFCLVLATGAPALAQDTVEWTHLGGNAHHTRYTPATNITPENFGELKEAWVWDGASFDAASGRSTPSYVDGKLFTVAGPRRDRKSVV